MKKLFKEITRALLETLFVIFAMLIAIGLIALIIWLDSINRPASFVLLTVILFIGLFISNHK